jgi:nickel transport protein
VDQALARQLSPLTEAIRQLEKQQERASFRDILGGIGYIVGLLGLYYYFRGRPR